ncbi:transglycosylase SLT domain-containing protein [Streptomyces sp. ODS28]|uniref:aggregation-promoting factor C-terminal-like domain-containing protein n=1 Tax=Streptomyces sp. ODS28 TaxID=3136688 RepID=UPI0031EAA351
MTRISVRGFAVASATAVTTVGAVVGVASGAQQGQQTSNDVEATAADSTLLADIPAGQQTQAQTASLSQQADTASSVADAEAQKSAEEAARKQAAEDAAAKKEAAKKAAAEKAEKERQEKLEASRSEDRGPIGDLGDLGKKGSYSIGEVKSMAQQIVGGGDFQCFSSIVDDESGWDYQATNPSSGAYGLMQALPGSKMSSAGSDWKTNPATQIKWGLNYMNDRYGSPCEALSFRQANGWY